MSALSNPSMLNFRKEFSPPAVLDIRGLKALSIFAIIGRRQWVTKARLFCSTEL